MNDNKLSDYEHKLLEGWEEAFKKGQLTLWIMLSLREGPKHMAEIKDFISRQTDDTLSADDQSMYRSLRRYTDAEMIQYETEPGEGGPERKIYRLTPVGEAVLSAFLDRNVIRTLYKPSVQKLVTGECNDK